MGIRDWGLEDRAIVPVRSFQPAPTADRHFLWRAGPERVGFPNPATVEAAPAAGPSEQASNAQR